MKMIEVLRECALELLDTEEFTTTAHIVACAKGRYPEVFIDEAGRLVDEAARRMAKSLMDDLAADDNGEQLAFEGLRLPTAIAVPAADGYRYVRTDRASWEEFLAGREQRMQNIVRAQRKMDTYDESLAALEPFKDEPHPYAAWLASRGAS